MGRILVAALRAIGVLAYRLGLAGPLIWLGRRRPKVLLFHAVSPDWPAALRGVTSNTPPARFAADLDFLRRHYNVIPIAALERGDPPERAVVITFDDGFRSVYEHAFPALRSRGLPAAVYLVTDVVDTGDLIWVNELNYLLRTRPLAAVPLVARKLGREANGDLDSLVYDTVASLDRPDASTLLAELRGAAGPSSNGHGRMHLSWGEIGEMKVHGITFGNHTADHPNLARLDRVAQRETIERARDELRARLGEVTSLSYPFGHHDETSREIALECGHASVLEVGGVNAPLDPSRVARVPVSARSDAELFADLEVVEPAKAWLRRCLRAVVAH